MLMMIMMKPHKKTLPMARCICVVSFQTVHLWIRGLTVVSFQTVKPLKAGYGGAISDRKSVISDREINFQGIKIPRPNSQMCFKFRHRTAPLGIALALQALGLDHLTPCKCRNCKSADKRTLKNNQRKSSGTFPAARFNPDHHAGDNSPYARAIALRLPKGCKVDNAPVRTRKGRLHGAL